MDAANIQVQHEPARKVVRDSRGIITGLIERQQHVGRLVARDAHGSVVGTYDERSRLTRDARGRIVGTTNLLPALLWRGR